jgi:hypothetical protein
VSPQLRTAGGELKLDPSHPTRRSSFELDHPDASAPISPLFGTIRAFKHRIPFRPFSVALVNGDRLEVDHPDALAVRDGVALFAGPGGVPVILDYEGVSQIIGDLAGRSSSE